MTFELPALPYSSKNALAPYISEETLDFHHGKHHQGYVNNLNKLSEGTDFETMPLEDVIMKSDGGVFNNAAQVWNHTFYWHSMKPGGGGEPTGALLAAIERDFGSFADFRAAFVKNAATLFGSGWGWLVLDGDKLGLLQTSNADTAMRHGVIPLVTVDVWEHAYYIDQRNARPKYLETFMDHLINWDFAAKNLDAAKK